MIIIVKIFRQRPRRVGARFTGEDIKPDEYLPEQVNFDYDGKRDRYNSLPFTKSFLSYE